MAPVPARAPSAVRRFIGFVMSVSSFVGPRLEAKGCDVGLEARQRYGHDRISEHGGRGFSRAVLEEVPLVPYRSHVGRRRGGERQFGGFLPIKARLGRFVR